MVVIAMDCEMVGSGKKSLLARVSIVDENGIVVLDEYVKPRAKVTDYRKFCSGISEEDLENGIDYNEVKLLVVPLLKKKILVGHSLINDLRVLGLCHPESRRRDLANYKPFQKNGQPQSLKKLAQMHLNKVIQEDEHDSLEDAETSMELYQLVADDWENSSKKLNPTSKNKINISLFPKFLQFNN